MLCTTIDFLFGVLLNGEDLRHRCPWYTIKEFCARVSTGVKAFRAYEYMAFPLTNMLERFVCPSFM